MGGNIGIGLEIVKIFVGVGVVVIVLVRDVEKVKWNLVGIFNVEIEEMDLMNFVFIDVFV